MLIALLTTTCLILVILLVILQRKNQALRQDRQGFLALAENIQDLIFRYDRRGRPIYVSPAVTRIFGVSVEDIVGKSPSDNPFLDSRENGKLLDGIRRVFETGETQNIEVVFADQQGQACSYKMLLIPECDAEKQVSSVLVLSRDITAICDTEQELKQALESIDGIINAIPDLLFEFDLNGTYLNVWAQNPALLVAQKEELLGSNIRDGLPPEAAETAMSAIEEANRKGSSLGKVMRLELPQGESWFELSVSRKPCSSDTDRRFIVLSRDITERKSAEQGLKQALESIDGIINAIPDLLFEVDQNGTYHNVWAQNPELLAAQKEALLGNTICNVLLPDAAETAMSAIEEADRKGSSFGKVMRLDLPQGESWFELSVSRKPGSSDTDRRFIGLSRDITKRKQLEDELSYSQNFLNHIIEVSADPIWVKDREHRWIHVNEAFCRFIGRTREELIGKSNFDFYPEQEARVSWQGDDVVFTSGKELSTEEELTVREGEKRYILIRKTMFNDIHGNPILVGVGTDITERRRAELLVAAREREFRSLAESLPDNIIRYNRKGVTVYVNQVLERTLGESAAAMIGATTREHHPDGSYEDYAQLLDEVLVSGEAAELERLVPDMSGEAQVYQIRMIPEFDDGGEVLGVLAIGRDITESRRAEEKLRLAASVFTSTNEGIVVTSTDNKFIDVNAAFTRITGYTREEVMGKDPKLLSSGRQTPEFYAEMWRSLNQTGHWMGEIWNRRKNGEEYPEWLTISVVNDEQGRLSHYVAVFTDITLIKEQEQQLQRIAHHDALTGLPNRLLFLDRLKQVVAQARRTGSLLAVCYGDLDGFKPVNDCYGHEAGDNVLVTIAKRMQECVRTGDTVGRIGGDEFVILLRDLESVKECEMVLTRLLDTVTQPIQLDGHSVSVSASLGVALFPLDDADPDLLLRHADQAMYQAKRDGKSHYRFFHPDQP